MYTRKKRAYVRERAQLPADTIAYGDVRGWARAGYTNLGFTAGSSHRVFAARPRYVLRARARTREKRARRR